MENERWLRCSVSAGQFPCEFAVSVQSADGRGFSLFAPEEDVDVPRPPGEQESVSGWIRVSVIERQGGLVLIRLPREAIEHGAYIAVRDEQLEVRPQRQEA